MKAVGDIHCQFDQLDRQLFEIGFNPRKDRLFSVGDLIDRGKDGCRVLDYLSKDWFYSILANHEDMILSLLSLKDFKICWPMAMNNGAQWLTANDKNLATLLYKHFNDEKMNKKNDLTFKRLMSDFPLIKNIYYEFSRLPYVIQIGSDVGLVHAEVPLFIDDWQDLVNKVNNMHIDTLESLLWGRMRIEMDINKKVSGINTIYCGHTPLPEADNYGNHRCIDIGACKTKSGKLHIEKINFEGVK